MTLPVLLLLLGVAVGAAGEWLLYGRPGGVNYGLFVIVALASVALLMRRAERRTSPWVAGLWGIAATLAGALALYDGAVVQTCGPWLVGATLLLATAWTFAGPVPLERFSIPVPVSMLVHLVCSPGGAAAGLREARVGLPKGDTARRVLRGVVASAPLLGVFTLLFSLSDEMFARRVEAMADWVSPDALTCALRVALFSAVALGLLRRLLYHGAAPTGELQAGASGDPLTVSVALGLTNALFTAFLLVQAKYLFAGEAAIRIPGVTYAEYARRGFFELETATLLVLLVVVTVHALVEGGERGAVGALSALLALQTLGVAASAVKRMAMYTDAYGLSVLRLYASAGIAVIGLLLVLTAWGTLRGRSLPWLASRLVYTALIAVAAVGLVDVEGTVARVNLARPQRLDVDYLAGLSADAVPAIVAAQASADPTVAALARETLQTWQDRRRPVIEGWTSYNLSRARQGP